MSCLLVLLGANLSANGVKLVMLGSHCPSQLLKPFEQVVVLLHLDVKGGY